MTRFALLITLLCFSACGGSPTSPSSTFTLSGTVFGDGHALAGASVTIMDGIHAGLSRDTDNNGNYSFLGLTPSAFTLRADGGGFGSQNTVVHLIRDGQSVQFQLLSYCSPSFLC